MKRAWRWLRNTLLGLLLITAVLGVVGGYAAWRLGQEPELIERWIDNTFAAPVEVAAIDLSWQGFRPTLELLGVSFLDDNRDNILLSVDEIRVVVDLLGSLRHWRFQSRSVFLSGAELEAYQAEDGDIALAGFHQQTAATVEDIQLINKIASWLLANQTVELHDIRLRWHIGRDALWEIDDLDFMLEQSDGEYLVHGSMAITETETGTLSFVLSIQDVSRKLKSFDAKLYLNTSQFPVVTLASILQPITKKYGVDLTQGQFSAEAQFVWKQGDLIGAHAVTHVKNLLAVDAVTSAELQLNRLSSNIIWQQTENQWQLQASNMQWVLNDIVKPNNNLSLQMNTANNKKIFETQVGMLDADLLLAVMDFKIIPDEMREQLQLLQPYGTLENTRLQLTQAQEAIVDWEFNTTLYGVGIQPHDQWPGMQGLNGYLEISPDSGHFMAASQQAIFNYPYLFRNATPIDKLEGMVSWQKQDDYWLINIVDASVTNRDVTAKVRGEITWFPEDKTNPYIDIQGEFDVHTLENVANYYPIVFMDAQLVDWLDQAIIAGGAHTGKLALSGRAQDFSIDETAELTELFVTTYVEQGVLLVQAGWPILTNISGQLTFHNREMDFVIENGRIFESTIEQAQVGIPYMGIMHDIAVYATAQVDMKLEDGFAFIDQSPLNETLGKALKPMDGVGVTELDLDLFIPIVKRGAKDETFAVKGSLNLIETDINFPEWGLVLNHANGKIQFTEKSVYTDSVTAIALGGTTRVIINTYDFDNKQIIDIGFDGNVIADNFYDTYHLPWLQSLSGEFNYRGLLWVEIEPDNTLYQLHLGSSLLGLDAQLPEPFAKTATEETFLLFTLTASNERQTLFVETSYGDSVDVKLRYDYLNGLSEFYAGEARINTGYARVPDYAGLTFYAELNEFDWDKWQPVLLSTRYLFAGEAASIEKREDFLQIAELQVGTFKGFGQTIHDIEILMLPLSDYWFANVQSSHLEAQVKIPFQYPQQAIDIEVNNANFVAVSTSGTQQYLSPVSIPSIDLLANNIHYDGHQFDQLQFNIAPMPQGLQINNLSVRNSHFAMMAKGAWRTTEMGDVSSLYGEIQTVDIDNMMQDWGVETSLSKTSGFANFSMGWPGALWDFNYRDVTGKLSLQLNRGRFTAMGSNTDVKMGLGRILTLFSFRSLPRRLSLDFSDLTQKGYSFESVRSDMTFASGIASTQNTFINGVVADVGLIGSVDLRNETYDLILAVQPDVTANLPLVATLIGTPLAGAAVWLASQATSSNVGRAVGNIYTLTGTWAEPEWEEMVVSTKEHNKK